MTKYEIIKKIVNSEKIDDSNKVWYIQEILGGWLTENEIKWIWEE